MADGAQSYPSVYKKLAMLNIQLQSNSANTLFYTTSVQYLNFLSTSNLK